MAFSEKQKRQHIRELQTYLHALSFFSDRIPRIIPDGIYGIDTSIAVRAFQREYTLPETGSADRATWNKIIQIYRELVYANPLPYNVFPSASYILRRGDSGLIVYIIQAMLRELSLVLDNLPRVEVDGSFGEKTERAVREFQRKSGIPANGIIDSGTWNMLARVSEHSSGSLPVK